MASVTGVTATRADQIEDEAVVNGHISNGDLILVTHGGTEINAGSVSPSPIDAWPIGSIFISVSSTNPATLLGGGTWTAWGTGRFLVGVDPGQTEFDSVQETGGTKTNTLTAAQVAHDHATHDHIHFITIGVATNTTASGASTRVTTVNGSSVDGAMTVSSTNFAMEGSDTLGVKDFSTTPVNNLPPYITCYMWRRVG